MRYFIAALIAGIVYQLTPTFGLASHHASLVILSFFVGLTFTGLHIARRNLAHLRERFRWKFHEGSYKAAFIFPTWFIGIFGFVEFVRWGVEKLALDAYAGPTWHTDQLARHVLIMRGIFSLQLLYLVGWSLFLLVDLVYSDDDEQRLTAETEAKPFSWREDLRAYVWAIPFAIIPITQWIWKSVLPAIAELARELAEDLRRHLIYKHRLEDNTPLRKVLTWWFGYLGRGLWHALTSLLPRAVLWVARGICLVAAACLAIILKPTEARSVLFLSEVFLLVSWAKMQGALTSRIIGIGLLIAALHVTVGFFLGDRLGIALKRATGREQLTVTSSSNSL